MGIVKSIKFCCFFTMFIQALLLIGCASYAPAEKANMTPTDILNRNAAVVNSAPCEFRVVVLKDRELAKNYVGIDPFKSSMIPVFLKVNNYGSDLIKVDIPDSSLSSDGGESFSSLTIEQAVEIARRSDAEVVGWYIAFGVMGALVSGSNTASVNKSLEEDYHSKSFKPTLINTKSSAEGLIFFSVPADKQKLLHSVTIQLLDLTSHKSRSVVVSF